METRGKRRKNEPVADKIRRGEISVVVAIAEELPDVFAGEILPKLDLFDTLSLAQVSKSYNDAVWSVEGVCCMDAKIEAHMTKIGWVFLPSMHIAARYGNLPAVRALLESGEDVNKEDPELGHTALHVAAYYDKPVTLKALIEAGADVNAQDIDGSTPLYSAAQEDSLMIVMELIKAGADVNLARHDGATPLHLAAQYGHEGCVVALIQAGADIHRRSNTGMTPIKHAIDNEHEKIVKLLRRLGARDD
ncbi:ankyrin repeat domain-containing protein [Candidatus Dependentiae bacterium]|jgi:ankyrin repeat protein|nr:ankyrin repeat domain-containing protein [Candidatus Dependentiae bacterium]